MKILDKIKRLWNNRKVWRASQTIDLWVDDERPAPYGWYHVVSVKEAKHALKNRWIRFWSLDHDLGKGGETYDLVKWLAKEYHENGLNYWPESPPGIHTQNPVGRKNIVETIFHDGPYSL